MSQIKFEQKIPRDKIIELINEVLSIRFNSLLSISNKSNDWCLYIDDARNHDLIFYSSIHFLIKILSPKTIDFPTPSNYFPYYIQSVLREEIAIKYNGKISDSVTKNYSQPYPEDLKNYLTFLKAIFSKNKDMSKIIRKHWVDTLKQLPPHLRTLEGGFSVMV